MTDIQALVDSGSGPIQFEGIVGEGPPGPPGGPLPAAIGIDLKQKPSSAKITQALGRMFEPGQTIELRILNAGKLGTVSGYFNDFGKLADATIMYSAGPQVPAVYITLNPALPALLARSANRAQPYAKTTTTDENVLCRRWLLVDIDPVRPAGISSSNSEKSAAEVVIRAVRDWLTNTGWPEPLAADSGNGFHLLYRIDMPNDDAAKLLIKACLEALARRFDTSAVKVDTSVFNAARIVKLYGSVAAKGDSTPDRPHRISRLFKPPEKIDVVSRELLDGLAHEALALEPPAQKPSEPQSPAPETGNAHSQAPVQAEEVERFLAFYAIAHKPRARFTEGFKWVLEQCFFDSNHKTNEAAVLLRDDGVLCYNCFHASCAGYHWKDFRSGLEARDGKKFSFNTGPELRYQPEAKTVEGSPGSITTEVVESEVREEPVPVFPPEALDGDYIGDLARILSYGTQIPPQFLRSNIKTILGAAIDQRAGFPHHEALHTRQYNINISLRERTGKGESWNRTAKEPTGLLHSLLEEAGIDIVSGGYFGSGQYMVKVLQERSAGVPNYYPLVRFDEMKEFFQRDEIKASTLETKLLELYEESTLAQGSFSNGQYQIDGVHLSLSGDFTRDGFHAAFASRGSRGSGFLARCVLSFGDKVPYVGDWDEYDIGEAIAAAGQIRQRVESLPQRMRKGPRIYFRAGWCQAKMKRHASAGLNFLLGWTSRTRGLRPS